MHYTQLIGGIESFWLEAYKSDAMSGIEIDKKTITMRIVLADETSLFFRESF